ncbi:MAG: hypothetical protein CVU39_26020 [Chloroflexi bacterium HGW-Chloroflexi-10]|nr:MAG: hypothetical protein CVU39_26020 [Chloroflexi bacterium HGW-Chloroflexi-10]
MEWTPEETKKRVILSAVLPYDHLDSIREMIRNAGGYVGVALLPGFTKHARILLPVDGTTHLVGLVGYPTGGVTPKTKTTEIREMIYQGCTAFRVVVNTGMLLSGEWEEVECDLRSTMLSAGNRPVGVIIEAAYLNDPQLQRICALATEIGAESVCAASGWLPILPDGAILQRLHEFLEGKALLETAGISSYDQFAAAQQAGVERFMLRYQHAEAILAQIS